MNTKEILTKLKDVFNPTVEEETTDIVEKTELSEETLETEVEAEEVKEKVELAEGEEEEKAPEVKEEPKVEYATKLELQELAKTFMEALEALQKVAKDPQDVPQDLSKQEVELKEEEVEEITHSPEGEVEKKVQGLSKPKRGETIQSRVWSKLFN